MTVSEEGDVSRWRLKVPPAHRRIRRRRPDTLHFIGEVLHRRGNADWALARVGGGVLAVGDEVTEEQLQLLIGQGFDPVTKKPLGRPYRKYPTTAERIERRTAKLDAKLPVIERAVAVAAIESEEAARDSRKAVAGFDFTFSIPKSASVLWAVSDAGTQSLIAEAHHAAVAEMVAFIERDLAATRVGAADPGSCGDAVQLAKSLAASERFLSPPRAVRSRDGVTSRMVDDCYFISTRCSVKKWRCSWIA